MVVCVLILVFLYVAAASSHAASAALALFLTTYCLIASFTEVGFTGASPYMLDVAVAASLLLPIGGDRERELTG